MNYWSQPRRHGKTPQLHHGRISFGGAMAVLNHAGLTSDEHYRQFILDLGYCCTYDADAVYQWVNGEL